MNKPKLKQIEQCAKAAERAFYSKSKKEMTYFRIWERVAKAVLNANRRKK